MECPIKRIIVVCWLVLLGSHLNGMINEALRQQLLDMCAEDQQVRQALIKNATTTTEIAVQRVDEKNLKAMKEIIATYGWPGVSRVGTDGAQAAWLLVQHASDDHAFQKQCLVLLQQAAACNDVSSIDVAYLADRMLIAEGKKQCYGTQVDILQGCITVCPIEDAEHVDARRKALGLQPLAEYLKECQRILINKHEA